jgi:hypothetical protein
MIIEKEVERSVAERNPISRFSDRTAPISLSKEESAALTQVSEKFPFLNNKGQLMFAGVTHDHAMALSDFMREVGQKALSDKIKKVVAGSLRGLRRHNVIPARAGQKDPVAKPKIVSDEPGMLEAAVDQTETATLVSQETQPMVRQVVARQGATSKPEVNLARQYEALKGGQTQPVYTYGAFLRLAKERRIAPGPLEGNQPSIVMPDGSIKVFKNIEGKTGMQQMIEFLETITPPTEVVPVYRGPTAPPGEAPIETAAFDRAQRSLFRGQPPKMKIRPLIPEPSADTQIKAANRELPVVDKPSPTKREISVEESPIVQAGRELKLRARTEHLKGEAGAKGLEVQIGAGKDGIAIHDSVTGETTFHSSVDDALKAVAKNTNGQGASMTEEQIESLLRRRFANARTPKERNAIRAKYSLYDRWFPRADRMGQLRPGEEKLASLEGFLNKDKLPPIELTPSGAPDISMPAGIELGPPKGNPPGEHGIDFGNVERLGLSRFLRIGKGMMLSIQELSHGAIPAFDKFWFPLSEAHNQMRIFTNTYYKPLVKAWKPHLFNGPARERISIWLEAKDKAAAIEQFGIKPKEVESGMILRQLYDKLWKDLKFADEAGNPLKSVAFLENYLPTRRKAILSDLSPGQTAFLVYGRKFPKDHLHFAEFERAGGELNLLERDAFKLFHNYLSQGARKRFLRDPLNEAQALLQSFPLTKETGPALNQMKHVWQHVRGSRDQSLDALNNTVRNISRKLGINLDEAGFQDMTSLLIQLSVGAHIAFRVPLVVRNFFDILRIYPLVGGRAFANGIRRAMTKNGKNEAIRDGIIIDDPIPFGDEIFNPFGPLGKFVKKGTAAYKRVDDLTRTIGHLAMKDKVTQAALKMRQGGFNTEAFLKETELMSALGPIETNLVMAEIKAGRIQQGARLAGNFLQQNTNFIYAGYNSPQAYRGVLGRLFGQFGLWPSSYQEYLRYLVRYGTPAERAAKMGRWMTMNVALGGAGAMMGVNFWKWLFFGPAVFTGGPIISTVQDAATVAQGVISGRDDPEFAFAKGRLARNLGGAGTFIPGFRGVKDIQRIIGALDDEGLGPAIVATVTGQIPEDPLTDELFKKPRRRLKPRRKGSKALQDVLRRR